MRFLCEQCKAKYQIADEKVAGKTVRMKCRKCGHLIEVKAEVTETSVASKAPPPPGPAEIDDATRVGMDMNAIMKSALPSKEPPTKPAAPRPGAKPGLATSLASAKPQKPAAPPQQAHGQGALAGAFQKTVGHHTAEPSLLEISTSSEWYCAINGVPVGPVRIAELRRKAAGGAVTGESLVWQEGMEEWRPLKTIPELAAIVQEGLSAERPSLVTPAPARTAPAHTPPPRPAAAAPTKPAPPSPQDAFRPAAAAQRSNVVSLTSRLATAEKLEPEPVADPFAVPAPISTPLSAPMSAAAPTVVIPRRSGPPWIAIGMVVAFGMFGLMAGYAFFFRQAPVAQPAPTLVVTTQAPAATTPVAAGEPTGTTGVVEIGSAQIGGTAANPGHVQTGSAGHAPSTAGTHAVDPSIAALLGGPGTGPSVGGNSQGGSASSALSEEAIQRVVQQRSAGVKRTCWERGGATQSNVNVRVHLTIAATGNVTSASADGNDPIVAKCIENSVHGWTFPVSSGSTTVDIPFHFLRQ
ncbi:MAG TPA: GYF domain-containing protein [Polyangiaceae bacterium]|jgi:predicted Zn finger-like uncharacterized protein